MYYPSFQSYNDIQSAIKTLGIHTDLHTRNHPDGDLTGTIRIQGANATAPVAHKSDSATNT